VTLEREHFLTGHRILDLQRLVVRTARDDPPASVSFAGDFGVLSHLDTWPVAASQTFTVPSVPAEAIRWLSGLKATLKIIPSGPLSLSISWPVAASQTFTQPP
jgi:hypothetical protein